MVLLPRALIENNAGLEQQGEPPVQPGVAVPLFGSEVLGGNVEISQDIIDDDMSRIPGCIELGRVHLQNFVNPVDVTEVLDQLEIVVGTEVVRLTGCLLDLFEVSFPLVDLLQQVVYLPDVSVAVAGTTVDRDVSGQSGWRGIPVDQDICMHIPLGPGSACGRMKSVHKDEEVIRRFEEPCLRNLIQWITVQPVFTS